MIEELRLSGIGVIDQAVVRFAPGLTVLTGETGAGKTMILTGLDLIAGGRSDPQLVRPGCDKAVAEAVFVGRGVPEWAAEVGGSDDDGAVIAARTVPRDGRARAFLAGRSVPAAQLAQFVTQFVTVHGQAEQLRLRSAAAQRDALDELGNLSPVRERYLDSFRRWKELEQRLEDWDVDAAERTRERAAVELALAEIEALDPRRGEDDELRQASDRLTNAAEISQATTDSVRWLIGDGNSDGAVDAIGRAAASLARAGAHDPALTAWASQLEELNAAVSSVAGEIGEYLSDLDADPGAIDAIHERRAALAQLARRWGPTLADVIEWAARARDRLAELNAHGEDRGQLESAAREARDAAVRLSQELHGQRVRAARQLEKFVDSELARLAMKGARFGVVVTKGELGPSGADSVEMTLQPHPDAAILPLAQSASGGELSRVMLALEVALASQHEHSYVFDEVDAGIGGATAVEVAARLKELSTHHQVVVVSHLPQVAAVADRHLLVAKSGATTRITELTGNARVAEIARMLAGDESPTALRHAAELLRRGDVGR